MLYSISTNTNKEAEEEVEELAPGGGGIGQYPAGYNLINIVILAHKHKPCQYQHTNFQYCRLPQGRTSEEVSSAINITNLSIFADYAIDLAPTI